MCAAAKRARGATSPAAPLARARVRAQRCVHLHRSGAFAFVELREASLAAHLILVFDGAEFLGRPLSVSWALRKGSGGVGGRFRPCGTECSNAKGPSRRCSGR